jgi:hypothetical protein
MSVRREAASVLPIYWGVLTQVREAAALEVKERLRAEVLRATLEVAAARDEAAEARCAI